MPLLQVVLVLFLAVMENLNRLGVAAVMTVLDPDGLPLLLSPGAEGYHHGGSRSEDGRTRGRDGGLQRVSLVYIVRFHSLGICP